MKTLNKNPKKRLCHSKKEWYERRIGTRVSSITPNVKKALDDFKSGLTPRQRLYHYRQYCARLRREELVEKHKTDVRDITEALRTLPNLDSIGAYLQPCLLDLETGFLDVNHFSAIGRKTLVEPYMGYRFYIYGKYLTVLLTAASRAGLNLRQIRGEEVPEIFNCGPTDSSHALYEAAENCHLLELRPDGCRAGMNRHSDMNPAREEILTSMAAHASQLRTLKIYFNHFLASDYPLTLNNLLEKRAFWPSLRCLKLGGFRASELEIRKFLKTHSSTLRSLELRWIKLEIFHATDDITQGSWVSLILFLQDQLALEEICLGGSLQTPTEEEWYISDFSNILYGTAKRDALPVGKVDLRKRIELFILNGGVLPLILRGGSVFDGGEATMEYCQRLIEANGEMKAEGLRFADDISWKYGPFIGMV